MVEGVSNEPRKDKVEERFPERDILGELRMFTPKRGVLKKVSEGMNMR